MSPITQPCGPQYFNIFDDDDESFETIEEMRMKLDAPTFKRYMKLRKKLPILRDTLEQHPNDKQLEDEFEMTLEQLINIFKTARGESDDDSDSDAHNSEDSVLEQSLGQDGAISTGILKIPKKKKKKARGKKWGKR